MNVIYEFGPFRLETQEHRLVRAGQSVDLTGKAFNTLCVLVERHGRLVSKQELMESVWPGTNVEENNLDRNISTLRKTLGERPGGHPYIETVPRMGYRFVAPVKAAGEAEAAADTASAAVAAAGPILAPMRQEIRFCTNTRDGVRLAYATVGAGLPLVKVANCFNHLDFEWESPIWTHWVRDLCQGHNIVRYDGRGNGLSEWKVDDISFEAWVRDLETVIDATGLPKIALLGHSQGGAVAIAYAARHPERVSHLILLGAYSRGAHHRNQVDTVKVRRALETLIQVNWGKTNPSFFQLVTDLYMPECPREQDQCWFKELQMKSVSPANLVRTMEVCDDINVRPVLSDIKVPTIVFHSDRDRIAPAEEGRMLAAEIPGARFVPLPSANHLLLAGEPAWQLFREELQSFLKCNPADASQRESN